MEFRQALDALIAGMTPQEWSCATLGGETLTVVPDGLIRERGAAEVCVRLRGREIGVTTAGAPALLAALRAGEAFQYVTVLRDALTVTPTGDGGVLLSVEVEEVEVSGVIAASDRLPLAAALQRAADAATGWEVDGI